MKRRSINLEEMIDGYFDYCDAANEGQKNIIKPYTLSGLLCYTGLTRESFCELLKVKRHKNVLSKALSRIEAYIEENMLTGALSCNASLNSLKYNFSWGEKQEEGGEDVHKNLSVTLSPELSALAV